MSFAPWRIIGGALLMSFVAVVPLRAQAVASGPTRPAPEPRVVELAITPTPTTRPALRHPLLPSALDEEQGNGAQLYLAAAIPIKETPPDRELIASWLTQPMGQLPGPEMLGNLGFPGAMNLTERAARRQYVHWDMTLRTEGMSALLPHLSPLRELGRMFAARARLHLAKRDHAAALRDLQTALALAHDLTEESVLVQALVASAIVNDTAVALEEFVRTWGSPNLYWSLAQLPRPFIEPGRTFQFEQFVLQFSYPALRNIDGLSREQFHEIVNDFFAAQGKGREWVTLLLVKAYPRAMGELVARGRSREAVEAMPVHQVMAHYLVNAHAEWCDELGKWYGLPYWQARDGLMEAERRLVERRSRGAGEASEVVAFLLPAAHAARLTLVMADRRLAAIQCVEAIRAHAAAHGGKLPTTLDEITETPAPLDPLTGRAFSYRVEGGRAVLDCAAPPERKELGWRYEIIVAK